MKNKYLEIARQWVNWKAINFLRYTQHVEKYLLQTSIDEEHHIGLVAESKYVMIQMLINQAVKYFKAIPEIQNV